MLKKINLKTFSDEYSNYWFHRYFDAKKSWNTTLEYYSIINIYRVVIIQICSLSNI